MINIAILMKINLKKFDFESDKILKALNSSERSLLLKYAKKLIFKKGKLIFYEGGIPTGVFIIKSGRAKIYKTGLDGKDQIFYIYKSGDILGYHALLCNELYEDACEALETCQISFISANNFNKLLIDIPKLQLLLIQNMSHEFGVLVNTITVLAQKPLRERLALYLLVLKQRYDGSSIEISRRDLANLVGTARESLGRLLKEFKEENLISIAGRKIEIINNSHLLQIASNEIIKTDHKTV